MKKRTRPAPKRIWVILDLHDSVGGSTVEDVYPTKARAIEQAQTDLRSGYTAGPALTVACYTLDPVGITRVTR